MIICVHLHISGRVQGVCYRASAQMQAVKLGLHGFARNLPDGRVEIIVKGEQPLIELLVSWCKIGPAMSEVTAVNQEKIDCTETFSGFNIRY